MAKTLVVDFDGVIHSYTSGWKGLETIPDPPVDGALQFLSDAVNEFDEVAIFSSRSVNQKGIDAMQRWLIAWLEEEMGEDDAHEEFVRKELKWPVTKPAAYVTLDDRAVCFDGTFPDLQSLLTFKPWNKKEAAT